MPVVLPGHAGWVKIREITANDADFGAWFNAQRRAVLADDPTGPQWREREVAVVYDPHEHHDVKLWLADDGGHAVGAAVLGLPLRDNLHLGEPELYVPPEFRRRGIGTALLEVVEGAARQYGRTSLMAFLSSSVDTQETPGTTFAEHHGFTLRITEIRRAQSPPFPLADIADAVKTAEPHAEGYKIITFRDSTPDELIEEYARLEARLSTDAPLGDLEYEGEVWDDARIRKSEERAARMGRASWCAVAIAPDGSMAGMTRIKIALDSDDEGFQDTTIVDPRHRGHRLGLLLKAANFTAIDRDRPGIKKIWTWNAETNAQMIAINETLGYRVEGWDRAYQRDVRQPRGRSQLAIAHAVRPNDTKRRSVTE